MSDPIGMPDRIGKDISLIEEVLGEVAYPLDHIHAFSEHEDSEAQKERFSFELFILVWHLCVWDFTQDFDIDECKELVENLMNGDDFEDSVLSQDSEPVNLLYRISFSQYWELLDRLLDVSYVYELSEDEVELLERLAEVSAQRDSRPSYKDSYAIHYLTQRLLQRCGVIPYDHRRLKFEYDVLVRLIDSRISINVDGLAEWINKALGHFRQLRIHEIASYDVDIVLSRVG